MDELLKIFPLGGNDPCVRRGRGSATGSDDTSHRHDPRGRGRSVGGGFEKGDGDGESHMTDRRCNGGGAARGGRFVFGIDENAVYFQG